jgi:Bacterial PH domain
VSAAQQQPGQAGRPGGQVAPPRPGQNREVYRSTVALVVWWVWVAFAAINLIDLAVQGRNHFAAMVAAILVMVTGLAFVVGFCPRVIADADGLTIQNPLRGHRVPWSCVDSMELGDSLEIHCTWQDGGPRHKKLYGWAVHSPRRSRLKAEIRARRKVNSEERRSDSFSRLPPEARAAMTKTDAEHIVDSLRNRADKARTAGAEGGRVVSRWELRAIAALVLPAILLIVVALV